ncbi:hypothetical protein [Helicobacter sp.]|uniref:hypothetical protein n=1 Tax=Helicobacter sp. TaxID=218 RepID=UPI00388E033A
MSKKERVKVTIDFIKAGFFSLLAALFGIFGFVVVHIDTIGLFQACACFGGVVCIAVIFYFLLKYLLKNLDDLEKMP